MKTTELVFESMHKDPGESPLILTLRSDDEFIDHTIDEMLGGGYSLVKRRYVPWWKRFIKDPFNTFILGSVVTGILYVIWEVLTWKVNH